jgi:hypothetical protein
MERELYRRLRRTYPNLAKKLAASAHQARRTLQPNQQTDIARELLALHDAKANLQILNARYFPATSLSQRDKIRRTANVVGLSTPDDKPRAET